MFVTGKGREGMGKMREGEWKIRASNYDMSKSQRHNIRNIVSDIVNSVVWGKMVATCVVGTYEV